MRTIPVSEPVVGPRELEYVSRAVRSGWISSEGEYLTAFEGSFASYVQRRSGVAVSSGTNALILALRALELPAGSEVIVPSFTIISCALACVYNGLVPVFIDADPETWNIDPAGIEEKVTPRTKAVMLVHIYGHPVDVDTVLGVARRHGLFVIEDFAEAIGSEYKGRKCGGFGDIRCVSFYANKTITTGEGGMCLTDDAVLAGRMKSLRNLAFVPEKRFVHYEAGFNFRMTNVQAAIGLAQLERIEEHVQRKVLNGKRYAELLKDVADSGVLQLPAQKPWAKNTYWMFGMLVNADAGISAEKLSTSLLSKGIQTRPFFYPMHRQPMLKRYSWFREERLIVAERLYEQGLYLPSGLTLKNEDLERVAQCVREAVA